VPEVLSNRILPEQPLGHFDALAQALGMLNSLMDCFRSFCKTMN
jgi:hypothetical protein